MIMNFGEELDDTSSHLLLFHKGESSSSSAKQERTKKELPTMLSH